MSFLAIPSDDPFVCSVAGRNCFFESFLKRLFPALLLCLSGGCSAMHLESVAFFEKEPEFDTPLQVIPVWSNTVLHQAGKHGTRGFGGRVIFYGEKKKRKPFGSTERSWSMPGTIPKMLQIDRQIESTSSKPRSCRNTIAVQKLVTPTTFGFPGMPLAEIRNESR